MLYRFVLEHFQFQQNRNKTENVQSSSIMSSCREKHGVFNGADECELWITRDRKLLPNK